MEKITNREELKFFLREDRKRAKISSNPIVYYALLSVGIENYHAYRYVKCLRKCEYHLNTNHKLRYLYYRVKLYRLGLKYNIRITPNTCGYGLRLMHIVGGIYINANKIGNYCGFNGGVLLGNKDNIYARPTIGDHVAFGPGAKAIGEITIGNNVFVAANAVVVKDIPDNCIVGGVPAEIIKKNK